MTNIRVLIKKISEIEKYLQIVKKYRKYSQKEIEDSLDLKGAVERYLYLLCQAVLDFSDAIVSYSSFRTPSTYGETFEILEENEYNILTKKLIEE
ncbi:MAG: HepT-like ribonuclease domain-containing protein, partial [Patescibacteria group bacterium]